MKLFSLIIAAAVFFSSCGGGGTKVLVMASGKIAVNGNTVTLEPGSTHNEATVEPDGNKITVNSAAGNKDFDVKESGLYLLNLKRDTMVGSFQKTGTDNSQIVISQDNLWQRVDSLTQLTSGQNVSDAKKNYFLPPMSIAKITANTGAQIIGPYRKIPGSFDPSKEHEVYKFYTNKEIWDIINKVKKNLSGNPDSTNAN